MVGISVVVTLLGFVWGICFLYAMEQHRIKKHKKYVIEQGFGWLLPDGLEKFRLLRELKREGRVIKIGN